MTQRQLKPCLTPRSMKTLRSLSGRPSCAGKSGWQVATSPSVIQSALPPVMLPMWVDLNRPAFARAGYTCSR